MTKENAIKAIINYFDEHEEDFNNAIEELDSYNGYLGDCRYYNMIELDEVFHDTDPIQILNRAFNGHDEDWVDANGNYSTPFNPHKRYFIFNGYGNLVSTDYKDYSGRLDDYFVECYIDNAHRLFGIPDDVKEIIEAIET